MTQPHETQSEHPLVGQTIAGKYKVVRLLGEGGMGCVYQGEQMLGGTTRKVAIKTLHKHLSHDESIKARFQREVGTVAALEHPNTIQVFDFGSTDDGTLYIVMEFVQGRSVADVLEKDGPMQPDRVLHIMRQVCGSLEEAHGHGIVHRDLKPDNVILAERAGQKDWVEVLDFGIAKRSSEHDPNEAKLTQQGMVLGTPPYMSPEQFTGLPVDQRTDIYALGVMAYEMLTGRLPWVANTAWEWASKHMTEAPTPLERQPLGPNVPEPMRAAITRALAKNKDERFSSVKDFFEAFSGSAAASAMSAAPAQPAARGTAIISGGAEPAGTRAKTEMGAPVPMMAPEPAPAYGTAPNVGPAIAAPAVVPSGPTHQPAKKGGPSGLVIGLGALAALLFVGAGIGIAMNQKKPTPTPAALDLAGTTTASATASTVTGSEEPSPSVTAAAALDSSGLKVPAPENNNTSGATKTPTKAPPVPTPAPVKPPPKDPPECKTARDYKAAGRTAAVVQAWEAKCRAAGGAP
jgi:serine/threonine-protein kinase